MSDPFRAVRPPTGERIRELAAVYGVELTETEQEVFEETIPDVLEMYERLDDLPSETPPVSYPEREPGHRPPDDENPHNAFVTRCAVRGAPDGPLAGYEVGVKDTVAVAGVEQTGGSALLRGYVPEVDATVVSRILDAGGTIVGKLNMTALASDGEGTETATGPVTNPHDPDHLAGGSSSGAGAAVAVGAVDVAIGADQGGSIRIPASWCGCVGHKPTHGLVPYTGIVELDPTIDHAGPLASTVEDCARTLEVVAGEDPLDPRSRPADVPAYTEALPDDPSGLRVGVLEEGFGLPESEPAVDEAVRAALDRFEDAGADLVERSVPWHRDGLAVLDAIAVQGMANLVRHDGVTHSVGGFYDERFVDAFGDARRARANELPPMLKRLLVVGEHLAREHRSRFYAKAQNLRRPLAGAYDGALADVDVLAMPTIPQTAFERTTHTLRSFVERSFAMRANCAPFNATGHPAITVPCGPAAGLPVGLQFVGERHDDAGVLAAASAYERRVGWDDLRPGG